MTVESGIICKFPWSQWFNLLRPGDVYIPQSTRSSMVHGPSDDIYMSQYITELITWKKWTTAVDTFHDMMTSANGKKFPRYWPFVRGIHRSPVNFSYNGQWCGASMFSLICAWINGCVNNREAGDLRRHRPQYEVIAMRYCTLTNPILSLSTCFCQLVLAAG